jgi:hypothetical protein
MLFVEDGTGSPIANAYIDIPYVSNYLLGEQLDAWVALSEPEQESAIVRATRFIDSLDFIGTRKTLEQNLSWPRSNVVYEGFEIEGVPEAVRKATAESVGLVLEGAEFFSDEADKQVASEKVDVIQTSYFQQTESSRKAATKFDVINGTLRGFLKAGNSGGSVGSARVLRT